MIQTHFPNQGWIAPLAGTVLISIACCQLVYSTFAVAAAFGMSLLGDLFNFGRSLASMGPDKSGDPFTLSAMTIAHLGLGLAIFALIAGILILRNHRIAYYFIAVFVVFSCLLACYHLLISWYTFTAIYMVIALAFTVLSIARWRLHGSMAFDAPSKKGMIDE